MKKIFSGFWIVWFSVFTAYSSAVFAELPLLPEISLPRQAVTVYFNQCYDPLIEQNETTARDSIQNPEKKLFQLIRSATQSINVCIFDIDTGTDQLIEAHRRGVQVRVVTETANLTSKTEPGKPRQAIQDLIKAGIPVVDDKRNGFMHHKFIIIDDSWVWFSSINLTETSLYHHNNNAVLVRSPRLAETFSDEFNYLLDDGLFSGPRKPVRYRHVRAGDVNLEVHFSPNGGARNAMLRQLENADKSIRFMAFSYTDNIAASTMIEKFKSGLQVEGIYDECLVSGSSTYRTLLEAGIPVMYDGNQALMHHKVIIVDDRIVITGSYNFSLSAEISNNETMIIMRSPRIAKLYIDEFERLKHGSINHKDLPPYDHPACRRGPQRY